VLAVKTRQTSSFSAGLCRVPDGDEINLIPKKVGRECRLLCSNVAGVFARIDLGIVTALRAHQQSVVRGSLPSGVTWPLRWTKDF
jgi:hypothetical protein